MEVFKRDGRRVPFQKDKIENAILKAFEAVDGEQTEIAKVQAKDIADRLERICSHNDPSSVEDIQNYIEDFLMSSNRKDVARAYIIYRNDRNRARERSSTILKDIEAKLHATDVQNQNANVDERSFGGRMGSVNSEVMKKYALDHCMSEMAKQNHLNNEIYIHDLDHYAVGDHNCLSIPFDDLLAKGFNTRQTDVRPAQSINTAFQLVAVLFQIQSLQQFGGVSATHLDWTMVPYVRKSFYKHYLDGLKYLCPGAIVQPGILSNEMSISDPKYMENKPAYKYAMDMTERECYQAVEGMYHNLNTLQSRSGCQLN